MKIAVLLSLWILCVSRTFLPYQQPSRYHLHFHTSLKVFYFLGTGLWCHFSCWWSLSWTCCPCPSSPSASWSASPGASRQNPFPAVGSFLTRCFIFLSKFKCNSQIHPVWEESRTKLELWANEATGSDLGAALTTVWHQKGDVLLFLNTQVNIWPQHLIPITIFTPASCGWQEIKCFQKFITESSPRSSPYSTH